MIDYAIWPFAGHVEHRNAMFFVEATVDAYGAIAAPSVSPGDSANAVSSARTTDQPGEDTSVWVVGHELPKPLTRQLNLHSATP